MVKLHDFPPSGAAPPGGRTTRHVTVANLKDFIAGLRARMAAAGW
jgi:hypothetical protein